jgi:hypothetical protein
MRLGVVEKEKGDGPAWMGEAVASKRQWCAGCQLCVCHMTKALRRKETRNRKKQVKMVKVKRSCFVLGGGGREARRHVRVKADEVLLPIHSQNYDANHASLTQLTLYTTQTQTHILQAPCLHAHCGASWRKAGAQRARGIFSKG